MNMSSAFNIIYHICFQRNIMIDRIRKFSLSKKKGTLKENTCQILFFVYSKNTLIFSHMISSFSLLPRMRIQCFPRQNFHEIILFSKEFRP